MSALAADWYEELRERYRPERICVLLVAESPPDPGDGKRRFFYSPELRADNLYRGVAQALYGERDEIPPEIIATARDLSACRKTRHNAFGQLASAVARPAGGR